MLRGWARVGCATLALSCGFGALQCKAKTTEPVAPEPWTVTLSFVSEAVPGAVVSRCRPGGDACEPVAVDQTITAPALIKTSPDAIASLRLGDRLQLHLAGASSVSIELQPVRAVRMTEGTATLDNESSDSSSSKGVVIRVAGQQVHFDDKGSMALRVIAPDRVGMTVHRGTLIVGKDEKLRAGETVTIAQGGAIDRRSAWRGETEPVLRLRAGETTATAPDKARGLGRMTARIPGQEAVVSGVRLVSHDVRVVVRDGFARTEVVEEFYNEGDRVLEGRYVFAVPAGASISRLALWVNDKLVEGEVVERERAARIFKNIVDDTVRPRDPALLEWVSGGEFSLKVFPIEPKKSRRVLVAYNEALTAHGKQTHYVYPLSLGADRSTSIDRFSMHVEAHEAEAAIADVQVPHYRAEVKSEPHEAVVHFEAKAFEPKADFVVSLVSEQASALPVAVYDPAWGASADGGLVEVSAGANDASTFALRLYAALPEGMDVPKPAMRERAIVLDTSQGQAKETFAAQVRLARGLLRRMASDERFALLACDTDCVAYPERGLAAVEPMQLDQADAWLQARTPGGASDLGAGLRDAMSHLDDAKAPQMVVMHDGSVTAGTLDAAAIAAELAPAVQKRGVDVRFIGVGRTVDEVTLRGLARSVGATYEPLGTGASLDERVETIALHLRSPVVEAVQLSVPEGVTDVHPKILPNLRLGESLLVVGKRAHGVSGPFVLRGRLEGRGYELAKKPSWPQERTRQNPLVPRLWAEASITDLEASDDENAKREIVALSTRHHVMSRHTAMLVLESERMFADFGIDRTQRPTPDAEATHGERNSLWGEGIGDAFGAGGLGLSGIGEGGGGRGEGIGLDGIGKGSSFGIGHGSARTHPPRVRMGTTSVSGRIPPEVITRIVRRNFGRMRHCYEMGLQTNPNLTGRVVVRFVIGRDGRVSNVNGNGDLPNAAVINCVTRSFYGLSFPQPEGGIVTVVYPIQFSPGDGSAPATRVAIPRGVSHRAEDEAWRERGKDTLEKLRGKVEADGTSRKAHANLIRGLLRFGQFEDALSAARQFAELDPDLPLARELVANAEAALGNAAAATQAVAAQVEAAPASHRAQARAAKAYEALGEERRACSHWRAASALVPRSDDLRYESLRCAARALGDRRSVMDAIRAMNKPAKAFADLLALLEGGKEAPAHDAKHGSPGTFEVEVTCDKGVTSCPTAVVIGPTGTVLSPWTPGGGRSGKTAVAFIAGQGTYRTLIVGGDSSAKGRVRLRAEDQVRTFTFDRGGPRTVAATDLAQRGYGY